MKNNTKVIITFIDGTKKEMQMFISGNYYKQIKEQIEAHNILIDFGFCFVNVNQIRELEIESI